MPEKSLLPLTAAQRASAARYPWYRDWLLQHGRTVEEVDGPRKRADAEPLDRRSARRP